MKRIVVAPNSTFKGEAPNLDQFFAPERGTVVKPGIPYFKVVSITPALAMSLLKRMPKKSNRKLKRYRVNKYAVEMREGQFLLAQPILFDWNREPIDGQHRLLGVVLSGRAITMAVGYNYDPKIKPVIDKGAGRSNGDVARISLGVTSQEAKKASAVGAIESLFSKQRQISALEFVELYTAAEKEIEWVFSVLPNNKIGHTQVRAALAVAYKTKKDQEKVAEFARLLKENDGLRPGNPVHTLRRYLLESGEYERDQRNGDDMRDFGYKVLRSVYAFVNDHPMHRLFGGTSDPKSQQAMDYFAKAWEDIIIQQSPTQQANAVLPDSPEADAYIDDFIDKHGA